MTAVAKPATDVAPSAHGAVSAVAFNRADEPETRPARRRSVPRSTRGKPSASARADRETWYVYTKHWDLGREKEGKRLIRATTATTLRRSEADPPFSAMTIQVKANYRLSAESFAEASAGHTECVLLRAEVDRIVLEAGSA